MFPAPWCRPWIPVFCRDVGGGFVFVWLFGEGVAFAFLGVGVGRERDGPAPRPCPGLLRKRERRWGWWGRRGLLVSEGGSRSCGTGGSRTAPTTGCWWEWGETETAPHLAPALGSRFRGNDGGLVGVGSAHGRGRGGSRLRGNDGGVGGSGESSWARKGALRQAQGERNQRARVRWGVWVCRGCWLCGNDGGLG